MLAESSTDGGMVTQVVDGDTKSARRCTLTRAASEMGVHRRADVNAATGAQTTDDDRDRPTPLQVSVRTPRPHRTIDY